MGPSMPAKQRAPLAARKHWLTPERLANYAPELNDIERDWKTLKAPRPQNLQQLGQPQATIDADIEAISSSRKSHPLANQRISA
jgi:transposase